MTSNIAQAAQMLYDSELQKSPISPIRDLIGVSDLDLAYKIQDLNTQKKLESGQKLIGRKIGLTSFSVQKQLGVDQPDFGMLFGNMEIANGGIINWAECMQPKAEAEIAFILGKDLNEEEISIPRVISAIEYVVPCIEIVGSRIKDWNIKITDTIADNASASHFVIGHSPKKITEIDVVKCKMELLRNGNLESEGLGSECMGSPINATWWLANTMVKLGKPLKAGDLVLAGALGPMVNANPGDIFTAKFTGLGSVSVGFGNSNN